jgi:hypothetical protein
MVAVISSPSYLSYYYLPEQTCDKLVIAYPFLHSQLVVELNLEA